MENFFSNFKNVYIFGSKSSSFSSKIHRILLIFPSASSSFSSFTIKANLCYAKIKCKHGEVGFKCILFRLIVRLKNEIWHRVDSICGSASIQSKIHEPNAMEIIQNDTWLLCVRNMGRNRQRSCEKE